MLCEPLKHARCDIILEAYVFMRRSEKCSRDPNAWCYNYGWIAHENNWPAARTTTFRGPTGTESGTSHV